MKLNKKIIIIFAVVLGMIGLIYYFQRPKGSVYKTAIVSRGAITQEIAETGTVKKGEEVDLNFKSSGTVKAVNVKVGDWVSFGQILAELDTDQLKLQLAQAKANTALYEAQLEKLMNGAGSEDVAIGRSSVANAESGLKSARLALDNANDGSKQKLISVYKSAADALNGAYAKAYNAQNFASLLQRTYFKPQDDDSILVWQITQKMALSTDKIKSSLDLAQSSNVNGDFDNALSVALLQLSAIDDGLRGIRAICEKTPWRDSVSQTYKDNLDAHRDYVVAAYASINASRQNIELQKSANDISVNTAQAAVAVAEGVLDTAREQLGKTVANPRQEDIASLNAQIEQALAQRDILELQIADSKLKSPVEGTISQLNIERGETVSAAGPAIVVLPNNPYQIEVDVYEEDVAKEKVGNRVEITPVALPDKAYGGKVVSIDPIGKIVNGVVYYLTKIGFDDVPDGLKPDMSADVVIVTAKNDNALIIPENALQKNDQGYFIQILKNGRLENAAVQVGIKSKGEAEIIFGANEGDEIVIP